MRLISGASSNAGRGSSGMTLIEKKKEDDQQSELDRIIEEDRKNQERLQSEESQRQADQQTKQNESKVDRVLNKATDYAVAGFGIASKVVKGGIDAYNTASDFIAKKAEENPNIANAIIPGYKSKKQYEQSVKIAFDKGLIDEKTKNWLDDPVLTALNTETGAKVTGAIAKNTSNLPLKAIASVKAIGDDTYDEAISSLMDWRNDPTNPRWQKLLADVQDSGAQSAVGVLLSVGTSFLTRSPKAGQTIGMAYYGSISAESQRQEKGSVTSKKNIVVDTVGDIALGGLVESSLKAIIKDTATRTAGNVVKQTVKGAVVEGGTEVSQTMVKYANDYNDAKTDEEKLAVVDKTKNYVLNGGLLNEFLVGGISGGAITGFATMAGIAGTGKDGVDPSLQPKKPGSNEEKKGVPSLSADVDIAKLRDQAIQFKDSAEKNQDDPVSVEQYAAVREALTDYEIAFKERPVYISQNEQENPLLQIETVSYPDGKFSYRFSADVGTTSLDSNFDNQNTVKTQEEAIKKASETIKTWVEEQIATASDEAEAMKFQRIFDEADALITGKAKFEPVAPSIKEGVSETATQEIKTPDSVTDNYIKKAESAGTFEEFKDGLDQSTLISRIAPDIQLDDRNDVEKALRAFYDKNKKQVETVEKGENKPKKEDEKPLVNPDAQVEKPISPTGENGKKSESPVKKEEKKAQTKPENTVEKPAEEIRKAKKEKAPRRFGKKSEDSDAAFFMKKKKKTEAGATIMLTGKQGQIDYGKLGEYADMADESKTFAEFEKKLSLAFGLASGKKVANPGVGSVVRRFDNKLDIDPTLFTVVSPFDGGYVVKREGASSSFRLLESDIAEVVSTKTKGRTINFGGKIENGTKFFRELTGMSPQEFFVNVKTDAGDFGSFFMGGRKENITTKILEDLKGRDTVSKQYILDATNRGDIKQPERDLIREMLKSEGDTVNVKEFSDRVRTELLPLEVKIGGQSTGLNNNFPFEPRYENITLPYDLRGPVSKYDEHLYQSPIKTSAGSVHYNEDAPNYFAHSRIEDVPPGKLGNNDDPHKVSTTRRVIEIQSDLFQKARLENEFPKNGIGNIKSLLEEDAKELQQLEGWRMAMNLSPEKEARYNELIEKGRLAKKTELSKLEPYRNTWHERIIREELRRAAQDGKTKLQFPTGETAMKIEGLGDTTRWSYRDELLYSKDLTKSDLKVGMTINQNAGGFVDRQGFGGRGDWIITDVLGDGKFKAVPKDRVSNFTKNEFAGFLNGEGDSLSEMDQQYILNGIEQFDISGKVDQSNPIYRFYEKTVAKYLKNRYNAKLVTDAQGVKWMEVDVTKDMADKPVEAFALGDRSTRGKDGKFTGSESIDAIGKEDIEKALSGAEMLSVMKKMQKTLNPEIRNILAIKVAEKIVAGRGDSQFDVLGLFNPDIMTVFLDGSLSKKDAEYIFKHEVNHAAFTMLPSDKRQMVFDWYKNLSESEKINLYADKGVNGGETFSRYEKVSRGRTDQIEFLADETFNRYINKNPDERSELRKEFDDIVTALLRLIQRIFDVVYKSQRFGKVVRNRQITEAYYNAFRNKKGVFESSNATKKILELRGVKPGEIDFVGETRGDGPEFARAKSEPKPDSKTVRFAKIISRRRELRALKRKREAEFIATDEGQKIVLSAEANRENYQAPNENVVQGIKNSTYYNKEKGVSDAMGEGFLMEKNGRYVVAESSRQSTYIQRGYRTVIEIDSLASEAGFDRGQDFLQDQLDRSKLPESSESAIQRVLASRDNIYGKVQEELKKLEIELSQAKEGKGAFFQGMYIGSELARNSYKEKLRVLSGRKEKVRAAKKFFGLSDNDFKKIGGNRELQTMSEGEFQGFLNHIQVQAEKVILRSQAMELLVGQIQEKQLKRYDNLRRAMQLPPIDKMTTEQLREFDAALEFAQEGDEFFTQRQLETVKNTELKGIKTIREARERLSARLNMPLSNLEGIKVAPTLDRIRYDSALAEANPFYGMIVAETNTATLEADGRFITIEEEASKLIKAARKSRSRGIFERLAPKDSRIFAYLEASDKTGLALDMTKEELEAAEFIRRRYEEMRDYLVKNDMLKEYRENYVTHVRKGFLETLRDDGIVSAFKDIIKQHQEDEATFNILSADTGNILPLEKFFQFSLKRTGGLKPTENVATAFLSYTRAFEKKRALDGLIPKLDIYTYSIEPKRATKTGLQMDRSLKKFLNDYLNNKKGRRFDFGGFLRQGGKADLALRAVRALTTILDLGLSIPAGVASNVGEQTTNFVQMGAKAYAKGSLRYATFKGRRFLKKYRSFTGKNPWTELAEASTGVGDKFNAGMFILFRDAQVRANQQFLLGSITDEEYKSGEISPQRLGELNIAMGRWRVVDGAKSIIGSTSAGGILTQYKTWAVPIFRTTISDITTLVENIKDQGVGKALNSREGAELFRSIVVMGTVGFIVKALLSSGEDTEKEKSPVEKLVDKSVRDLLSTIGVFDPTFFASEPRVVNFLGTMAATMKSIGLLEEYADDAKDGSYQAGDLKGVKKLEKTLTPSVFKQFDMSGMEPDQKESVEKYLKQGLSAEEAVAKVTEEMKLDQDSETYNSDVKAIEKEVAQQKTVSELGKKTERINKARLKTTKIRILKEYQKDMSDQEFRDYIEKLYDGKVISKPVFQEFWNN